MFRITYGYFKINENFEPIGTPYVGYVDGETIKQVNNAFQFVRNNHDVLKYTPITFYRIEEIRIEEIEEH